MKIAQVAPLAEAAPPKLYGGTERVVSYLTEELVRLGHEVTLFATADSETRAELVPCAPMALRLDPRVKDPLPHMAVLLERVRQRAAEFEVLHFHIDHLHYPLFRSMAGKTLTTLHGRLDSPDLQPLFREFRDMPLVSISESQRRPMPPVHWLGTVHHGLPSHACPFNPAPRGNYFAFIGRISPEKGVDRAIEIAVRAGVRLRIAAKVDLADEAYFNERIEPLLNHPLVEYIGEVNEQQKNEFLGNANGLLFPVDWPEPFGLAMIEAMSCGTPVIAWPHGAVPEIVEHGVTGFLVGSISEAVSAVRHIARLDRHVVRERFEQRFTAERMARDYVAVYQALLKGKPAVRLAEVNVAG
jgi:glycosyltransferase involved in cell wall biosynthesis